MHKTLLQKLNQLVPLNSQQQQALSNVVQEVDLPKDYYLLEKGHISDHIYFVLEGVLHAFCEVEGKAVTRWLCFPEHFATSYFSFVYRQPSEDSISLLTNAKLLSISYQNLQYLARRDAVWVDLNRRLLEYYYTILLDRVMSFQTQSTAERYESLLQANPTIEEDVPLGCIASYLGMTQETLSRIRSRRKKRG